MIVLQMRVSWGLCGLDESLRANVSRAVVLSIQVMAFTVGGL